jgi:hypothetical protein
MPVDGGIDSVSAASFTVGFVNGQSIVIAEPTVRSTELNPTNVHLLAVV